MKAEVKPAFKQPELAAVARAMVACSHAFDAFDFWTELNPDRDLRDDLIDFHRFQAFLMRSLRW